LCLGVLAGLIGSAVIAGLTETIAQLADGSGQELFKVPEWAAWRIQRIQHWIAQKTWK
jgi:hypothetical protein